MSRGELYDRILKKTLERASSEVVIDAAWIQGMLGLLKECREAALIPELEAVLSLKREIQDLRDTLNVVAASAKIRTLGRPA